MGAFDDLVVRATALVPDSARAAVARRLGPGVGSPSFPYLSSLLRQYTTDHLVGVAPAAFEARIREFLALRDHKMEGFDSPDRQRDMSVRFRWGHDHDFGTFRLHGMMGARHLSLLATFIDRFRVLPRDLTGTRVLDIGCWTGGTSLLLAAMGADVTAIDEVRKYVDCLQYMTDAFQVPNLHPRHLSLYDGVGPEFDDVFDFVLFAGVLYHLSDPILGLRITFDCLREGGTLLLETAIVHAAGTVARYEGPSRLMGGGRGEPTRSGWNWFVPTRATTSRMMRDVGFEDVRTRPALGRRAFAVGRKHRQVDFLRAGLSRPAIR